MYKNIFIYTYTNIKKLQRIIRMHFASPRTNPFSTVFRYHKNVAFDEGHQY